jgi:hypothetical protein
MARIKTEETIMRSKAYKLKPPKMPKFKNESEEADWWYANRHNLDKWGKPVLDKDGNPMTPAQILAAHSAEQKQQKPVNIRLPLADIQRAKTQAERKGLPYQTYLKSLIHQALTLNSE